MKKILDYSTGVFLGDCIERSIDGTITTKKLIEAFWENAPTLLVEFEKHGIDPYGGRFYEMFCEEHLPGLAATLRTVGLEIKE